MIVCLLCGAAAGGVFAARFNVAGLFVFLVTAFVALVVVLWQIDRLDLGALIDYALFCGATQVAYFVTSVALELRRERHVETPVGEIRDHMRRV